MTDDRSDDALGREAWLRSHATAVWTLLCECLERKVVEFNSENASVGASVEPGVAIGLVEVSASGANVSARLKFDLAMNTAGLNGWVQWNMIRTRLPILMILEESGPSYRWGEEVVSVPAWVDRALEHWCQRYVFGRPFGV